MVVGNLKATQHQLKATTRELKAIYWARVARKALLPRSDARSAGASAVVRTASASALNAWPAREDLGQTKARY